MNLDLALWVHGLEPEASATKYSLLETTKI